MSLSVVSGVDLSLLVVVLLREHRRTAWASVGLLPVQLLGFTPK
jgi:hypothetical protein